MPLCRSVVGVFASAVLLGTVVPAAAHPQPRVETVVVDQVSIPVPGQAPLDAFLVRPDRGGKRNQYAGVLDLHWFEPGFVSADNSEFLPEAIALAQRGVVSVLPQQRFPWAGDPVGDPSDRTAVENGVADARAALDYLAGQRGVDPHRLAVVGHDYGAMYGTVLAETDPRVLAAVHVALDARWANWFDLFWLGLDGEEEAAYFALFAGLDPVDNVGRLGDRQFFQWAETDFFIPAAIREQFAAAAPSAPATTYSRVSHAMDLLTVESDRVEFLRQQLGFAP